MTASASTKPAWRAAIVIVAARTFASVGGTAAGPSTPPSSPSPRPHANERRCRPRRGRGRQERERDETAGERDAARDRRERVRGGAGTSLRTSDRADRQRR